MLDRGAVDVYWCGMGVMVVGMDGRSKRGVWLEVVWASIFL